jgi:peptide chain release factor 2
MRQLNALQEIVGIWRDLEKKTSELLDMVTLAIVEEVNSLQGELRSEIDKLTTKLDQLEIQLMLDGEYDSRDAILTIHAGAGGTESQDWAEMLLRMYTRWAERHQYQANILDTTPGEEAGIKSVTLEIKGNYTYGYLKSEAGVHRLVRLSPFDADHARHTSFALVEVIPEVKETSEIEILTEDLKIDTFRSSGPGGQHMQKTSSAVRITHLPTGIIVSCQSERSQHQNKDSALKVLYSRLLELELVKNENEKTKLKGKHVSAGWGNQIRSYVLHPYRMVKDHARNLKQAIQMLLLDGEIDEFITAYLRARVGEE